MRIEFNEKTHTYLVDGDFAHISVTELLRKHGLAPDLSKVKTDVLTAKATAGKQIHKDLENVLNKPKYEPKTAHGEAFEKWVRENLQCGVGEKMFGYDLNGVKFAGTADVVGFMKNGEMVIGDHKTTAKFEREYVSWQVSVLDYFARSCHKQKINGKAWNWKGATKFLCFWYGKDGNLEVKELEKVPDSDIERLLQAEYHGEIYQRPQLVIDSELQHKFEMAETCLVNAEIAYKQAKQMADTLRERLKEEMERQGIRSFETDNIKLTYVAEASRTSVDSTKLRREFPTVYQQVVKITPVKPSLRITIKGENTDDSNE